MTKSYHPTDTTGVIVSPPTRRRNSRNPTMAPFPPPMTNRQLPLEFLSQQGSSSSSSGSFNVAMGGLFTSHTNGNVSPAIEGKSKKPSVLSIVQQALAIVDQYQEEEERSEHITPTDSTHPYPPRDMRHRRRGRGRGQPIPDDDEDGSYVSSSSSTSDSSSSSNAPTN